MVTLWFYLVMATGFGVGERGYRLEVRQEQFSGPFKTQADCERHRGSAEVRDGLSACTSIRVRWIGQYPPPWSWVPPSQQWGRPAGERLSMPQRIQRKRTKGWKMPPNTVYVGRPTKFGNPYRPSDYLFVNADGTPAPRDCKAAREMAVRDFQLWLEVTRGGELMCRAVQELRGKDLACWCPLDQPCHADVLLELADKGRG